MRLRGQLSRVDTPLCGAEKCGGPGRYSSGRAVAVSATPYSKPGLTRHRPRRPGYRSIYSAPTTDKVHAKAPAVQTTLHTQGLKAAWRRSIGGKVRFHSSSTSACVVAHWAVDWKAGCSGRPPAASIPARPPSPMLR